MWCFYLFLYFFIKQKTANEVRISDWSSDVCSSDLVINSASAHGLAASPEKSAYVAAKHGIIGLTKVTALETAGAGITCNAICPGWVLTPLVKKQIEDRAKAENRSYEAARLELVEEKTPSKDFSTPEQIGGLAVFLYSPAADQMTGAPLSIDGGWIAQ